MPTPLYKESKEPICCEKSCENVHKEENNKLFGNFETDDIILAVVILMLLLNDCDDKLLLLALAFVFITGF